MKKKILGILLSAVMVVGLFPTVTYAGDDAVKAIQSGTTAISSPTKSGSSSKIVYTPNSYIYFGVNSTDSNTPIKWRVLDADKANDGKTDGMFLMSEHTLNSNVKYSTKKNNIYQGSNAQSWLLNFAGNTDNFSTAEQSAMVGVAKKEAGAVAFGNTYCYPTDTSISSELKSSDKMFLMSAFELQDYVGNYNNATGLAATDTSGNKHVWYLRTSYYEAATNVGSVSTNGSVTVTGVSSNGSVRPAFNLDPSTVLFTSAAEGGKIDTVDSSLSSVADYTGNEWKLTLLDSKRNFSAEISSADSSTKIYTVSYENATVGDNEYISAYIKDSEGNITNYGRLVKPESTSGTVDINLSGIDMTGKTLYVFSEQYNGGENDDTKLTDYASQPISVSCETTPGQPSDLKATTGCKEVTLRWTAPTNGGLDIIRYEYKLGDSDWVSTGSTDTNYTIKGLDNDTTYSVQVRAVNSKGYGSATSAITFTPDHIWSENWSSDSSQHWLKCTVAGCDAKKDAADHVDSDKDHECDTCGYKMSEHTGGTATCTWLAKCDICGQYYGEFGAHNLTYHPAVEATADEEGNIEYWYCTECQRYFSDADAKNEIASKDITTPKDEDLKAAREVVEKIYAIGTVAFTDTCKEKIDVARNAYDALTEAQKAKISYDDQYKVLIDAEKAYENMRVTINNAETKGSCLSTDYKDVPVIAGYVWDITNLADKDKNVVGVGIKNNDKLVELLPDKLDTANGVNVWLETTDASATASAEEKSKLEAQKNDYTIGTYMDLSMYAKENSGETTKISNLNGNLQVSISVPESLRRENRSYEIIRLHEGDADAVILQGTYDEETCTFTFETDRFSLYAIAYKDADQSVDSTKTVNTASVSSTATSPKTGETTNMTSCLVIFTAVLAGIYVGTCVKRRKENR